MTEYKGYTIEVIRGKSNGVSFTSYAVATHKTNGHILSGDIQSSPKAAINRVKEKIDELGK